MVEVLLCQSSSLDSAALGSPDSSPSGEVDRSSESLELEDAVKEPWKLLLEAELEWDLTKLCPCLGVVDRDLLGDDPADRGTLLPAGKVPPAELSFWEPAPSQPSASFSFNRLAAQASVSKLDMLSPPLPQGWNLYILGP